MTTPTTPDAATVPSLPIVFVHGSGDSARHWQDVIALLPDFTCVALDLPGHGAQIDQPGPERMSISDYAEAVRAELAARGLGRVCLAGHSLGSAIALRLALDHPSLVARLVVVGGGARLRVLPALLDAARAESAPAHESIAAMGFTPGHEALAAAYGEAQAPTAPGMLYRDLSACDAFDVMGELGRITQPALIVVGEQDRMTPPKYAAHLRDHLPDAMMVTVPDAGHFVAVEAPDAVASALRTWLSRES